MTSASGAAATATSAGFPDPAAIDAAHQALLRDKSIQFDLPGHIAKPNPPPHWLEALIKAIQSFVQWVGPAWTWILVALGVVALVLLLIALVPPLRRWALNRIGRRGAADDAAASWAPQAKAARALLDEADRLAATGRYGEAIHLILHRSIEDIERWRGDLVRPSLTSRDIAHHQALPDRARRIFADLVAMVERGFFAGKPLGVQDWDRARGDYAGFALDGR